MADNDDRFARAPELWDEDGIEEVAEVGILIRRPLVEHVDRPVLEERGEKGQALALPRRQRRGREDTIFHLYLALQLEAGEIVTGARIKIGATQSEQAVEEVKVRKDRREVRMVPLARRLGDEVAVQPDLAGVRRV